MMLNSSDKLGAGNTAALRVTYTECPGKVLTRLSSFLPAAEICVMVKALGNKLKDQLRLESRREKRKDLCAPLISAFSSHYVEIKSRLHLLGYSLQPHGRSGRKSSLQIFHPSKIFAIRLSDLKLHFMRCVTDEENQRQGLPLNNSLQLSSEHRINLKETKTLPLSSVFIKENCNDLMRRIK